MRRPAPMLTRRSGSHLSRHRGRGMDFDEVRPYAAGDDVRTIDWRVTARSGSVHTKLFREERERAVLVAVDLQRSMHFATQGCFKSVLASHLAALIAWKANQRGDLLGGMLFSEAEHSELQPRSGHSAVLRLLQQLVVHPSWQSSPESQSRAQSVNEPAGMGAVLQRLRHVAHPGSHITLISDFHALQQQDEVHLRELSRHCDLRFIVVHDRLEADLPPPGRYPLSAGGQRGWLDSSIKQHRQHYQLRYQQQRHWLQTLNRRYGISLLEAATDSDPLTLLQQPWLGRR